MFGYYETHSTEEIQIFKLKAGGICSSHSALKCYKPAQSFCLGISIKETEIPKIQRYAFTRENPLSNLGNVTAVLIFLWFSSLPPRLYSDSALIKI
jgi:hypothetical protein